MELDTFINNFSDALEVKHGTFSAETIFKDHSDWDSLAALNFIAMVDDIYNVSVTGNDIDKSKTISDLWESVLKRI